ncbi:unnamed protein product [Peniophora sp. CBMAI 1063]|nr:unnamed protein product [Peniophora sp. CBMAI 1063]
MPKITHILFDCDNTLVLSEHIAFAACAELANEVLERWKPEVADRFDGPTLQRTFVGQNFRGMLISLCEKYGFELPGDELDKYVARELDAVTAALKRDAEPCRGVLPVLQRLQSLGNYTLAVVSSSALPRVVASLERAGLSPFFAPNHIYSAITSLPTPTSKPDPAVYLHALRDLGTDASRAVAVEDSKSGATAAVRAGIRLVGYAGVYEEGREREEAKEMLGGVGVVKVIEGWERFAGALEEIEKEGA